MGAKTISDRPLFLPLRYDDELVEEMFETANLHGRNGKPLFLEDLWVMDHYDGDGAMRPIVYDPEELKDRPVVLVDTYTTRDDMNARAVAGVLLATGALRSCGVKSIDLATFPPPYARDDADWREINDLPEDSDDPAIIKRRRKLKNMIGTAHALDEYISFLHWRGIRNIVTSEVHNVEETVKCVEKHYGTSDCFYNLDPFIILGHAMATQNLYNQEGQRVNYGERGSNTVVVGPDLSATDRVNRFIRYSRFDEAGILIIDKSRLKSNDPDAIKSILAGQKRYQGLEGKQIILVDDMFVSLTSVVKGVHTIDFKKEGKPETATCVGPYALNTRGAYRQMRKNHLNMVVPTLRPNIVDNVKRGKENVTSIHVAPWLQQDITSIVTGKGPILVGENFENLSPQYIAGLYSMETRRRAMVPFEIPNEA